MLRFVRRLAPLLIVLLLPACATGPLEPQIDYNRNYDFTRVQKVYLLPYQRPNPTEIVLTDDQVASIKDALGAEMVRRGFQVVSRQSAADAWLSWHLVTHGDTGLEGYNEVSLYSCWRCGPAVTSTDLPRMVEGSFIVDIIDPVNNQSVWRSTVETRLQPRDLRGLDEERRREAASQVLADFPPH